MSFKSKINIISFYPLTFLKVLYVLMLFCFLFCSYSIGAEKPKNASASGFKWVGTWSTAEQLVETGNNPPSPGLSNNTLRQIAHVSIGGDSLRIKFSNKYSTKPVTLNTVHIAVSKGNGVIDTATDKALSFAGKPDATMSPGGVVTSDPIRFALKPLSDVAITIYFGSTSPDVTGHPGSRTTSFIYSGNKVTQPDVSGTVTTDHWYVINTIDVLAPDSAFAVVIIGNSITDGRGSGTNKQNRWPDELARRLQANPNTKNVAVLNQGIGGNCVLGACLGPSAISRFENDALNQSGVKWVILFEGINDIGYSSNSTQTAQSLISAFRQMTDSAHARGLKVYGATLLPFGVSSYDSPDHQKGALTFNNWIRRGGYFDGIIDFDSSMHDPANPLKLLANYDTGDHLHPNETGHHMMAEAVDLSFFGAIDTTITGMDESSNINKKNIYLWQNYPNPFNPSTVIKYQLPQSGHVTLKVFNHLGKEVAVLVDGIKSAGAHQVTLCDSRLASGVYVYRLNTENFMESKKFVILK